MAAGAIIMSFGNFVVGGNYVVGLVIFIILVLINFLVIAIKVGVPAVGLTAQIAVGSVKAATSSSVSVYGSSTACRSAA